MTEINWQQVARLALTSRILDEIEESELTPQGKITYQFSAKGHELGQVLLGMALNHPRDAATVYYRSRPLMLTLGLTLPEALAAGLAKTNSPSEGRDVGVVFSMKSRGGATVLPSSGDVGAQYTPAVGWAQAIRYHSQTLAQSEWDGALAVAHGGEGSVAANGFWAALNIAATRRLPYLFYIEDNAFAISVRSQLQTPGANIADNLRSFKNLEIIEGDTSQPAEAAAKIHQAVAIARSGQPCLLRMKVVRLMGHTFIDDQGYKTVEEKAREHERDPLTHLKAFLPNLNWDALQAEVTAEIRAAMRTALHHPDPQPDTVLEQRFSPSVSIRSSVESVDQPSVSIRASVESADNICSSAISVDQPSVSIRSSVESADNIRSSAISVDQPSVSIRASVESADNIRSSAISVDNPAQRINLIDSVRRTLEAEMTVNPRILVFGEDVGVKGGVHGATAHMQAKFGPERVFDTSLSEEGIMGSAAGISLAGLFPVPEIQFRKYADPATEQINDIGTIRWRTAGKFAAPMVVRIPVGFGKKTGDPWHSVSAEAIFAHTLGWRLAYPSNAADAAGLLRSALRGDDPTLFFEHRALLDTPFARRPYPGNDYTLPFGRAARLTEGNALTLITWGGMVERCLTAAKPFAGQVQVLDLRTIIPWDKEQVLESVKSTGKCLVVHEDTFTGGFGAEIIATVAEECFEWLDAPLKRISVPDVLIPYNKTLMDAVIPSADEIRRAISHLIQF